MAPSRSSRATPYGCLAIFFSLFFWLIATFAGWSIIQLSKQPDATMAKLWKLYALGGSCLVLALGLTWFGRRVNRSIHQLAENLGKHD